MWPNVAGFVAGCCLVLCLPNLPAWPAALAVVAAGAVLSAVTRRLFPLALVLGCAYCQWVAGARLADRLEPALEGQLLAFTGTVVSIPQGASDLLRFRFAPDRVCGLPAELELAWYDADWRPRAAEKLRLEARLRRPRGLANPGGNDNDARMLREGVGASGHVRSAVSLGRDAGARWRHPVLVARAAVAEAIDAALGARPAAGIVAGLSVGLQDALSREQWLELSRSGTSHLMAISGLHITMVAAIAAWLGGQAWRWRQRHGGLGCRRDAAVLCGMVAAIAYSALAGLSVPTQRTLVMIALGTLALLSRRRVGTLDALAVCAGAVVLVDPLALLASGFWLSFGAVAAILFATAGRVRRQSTVREYVAVQCAVTCGLTPVLVGSFGSVSLVAALVNLVAIPLYTLLIVPAVLVSTAVLLVAPGPGEFLLSATAWLIDATWPVIAVPAAWPLATIAVAGPHPVAWVLLILGTAAALAPLPTHGRVAGFALVVAACAWRPTPVASGTVRMAVLDVGQGLAAVVETRAHALVYDAGPAFRGGTDAGMRVVVPYLRQRGIRTVDRLVLSHDDGDHTGGAASVLNSVRVEAVIAGPSLPRTGVRIAPAGPYAQRCRRGERWEWDGVRFEWLHPGDEPYARDNDSSCVLRVTAGEHSLLLTGDIEALAEQQLVESGALRPVTLLVAPHHGSRTSSSEQFVAAAAPQWVLYSIGHRNRWGFPAPLVAARWRDAGARALATSTSGAIEFMARPGRPFDPPDQWRVDHHRFWQDP